MDKNRNFRRFSTVIPASYWKDVYYSKMAKASDSEADQDSPESFFSVVVDAMREFSKLGGVSIFELYAGLGTQILLEEGLLDINVD